MDNFARPSDNSDRRWACPGFYRMPETGDGRLCRIKLPLGCITPSQLRTIAEGSKQYGNRIIEMTNRSNFQIRGVTDGHQLALSQLLFSEGLGAQTQQKDDIRNVMINPTAGFDKTTLIDTVEIGNSLLNLLQNSKIYASSLSPKFSFYIDGGEETAYLEHAHDLWLSAINEQEFALGFATSPHFHGENMALGIIKTKDALFFIQNSLDLFIQFQTQYPDINRFKHLFTHIERSLFTELLVDKGIDIAPATRFIGRKTHAEKYLGKHKQLQSGYYYLNIIPPLGRLTPEMLEHLATITESISHSDFLHLTPWRGVIIPYCTEEQATTSLKELSSSGFAVSPNNPFAKIISCAGAPLCRSAHSNVQRDAAKLSELLTTTPFPPVHLTGCVKSCASTNTYPITLLATNDGVYTFYKDKEADYKNKETGRDKFGQLFAKDITINQAALILKQDENDGYNNA